MDIGKEHEYVVIGSGCTGAMAAQTLIEKGVKVLMLDVGNTGEKHTDIIPQKNFAEIRTQDSEQYKYWLGENFEAVDWGKTTTGAQLTPARKYVLKNTAGFLPYISTNFQPMESLSYGGLGNAWGLGCCVFSDEEIKSVGVSVNNMHGAYQIIADRIGISADKDDATPYTSCRLNGLQKSQQTDNNSKSIYAKYLNKREVFHKKGFYMGKPALALLTEKKDNRLPTDYDEMDFYSDKNEAAYRPRITVDLLKKQRNFQYMPCTLLLSFKEEHEHVVLTYIDTETRQTKTLFCKKLIICAGTLSTARIVLRSIGSPTLRLPLLCNPYKYFILLQPSMLGKANCEPRTAFAQLALYYDPLHTNYQVSAASIYSYRSLMLFRVIKEVPLGLRDARMIMQYLLPAISIMGVHHPDASHAGKYVEITNTPDTFTGDTLKITYALSQAEAIETDRRDKRYSGIMKKVGCYTLKKIKPGYGASVHYAGTLPFSEERKPLHLHPTGRLHGTQNVYVADGSGMRYLPAKGITLSIMAYAHLTALNALNIDI